MHGTLRGPTVQGGKKPRGLQRDEVITRLLLITTFPRAQDPELTVCKGTVRYGWLAGYDEAAF